MSFTQTKIDELRAVWRDSYLPEHFDDFLHNRGQPQPRYYAYGYCRNCGMHRVVPRNHGTCDPCRAQSRARHRRCE